MNCKTRGSFYGLTRSLGRPEEAKELGRRFLRAKAHVLALRPHYQRILRFVAGEMNQEELLEASHGSSSALVESHYFIEMSYLAKGDRATARRHLQAALDTGDEMYFCFQFATIVLSRLDMNPNWPPTIPVRTSQ